MAAGAHAAAPGTVRSLIPARIDRLPWSPFHTRMVVALGVAWILDGLEITVASAVADTLTRPETLGLSSAAVGLIASVYLAGEVVGALFFGRLSDKLGRRNLFMITLAVYLVATVATAFSTTFLMFAVCRFFTGAGIGGEYAAINSAIDELIPARVRGRVALAINGSWWVGTAFAAFLSYELLNQIRETVSWRLGFLVGAILALGILALRKSEPTLEDVFVELVGRGFTEAEERVAVEA